MGCAWKLESSEPMMGRNATKTAPCLNRSPASCISASGSFLHLPLNSRFLAESRAATAPAVFLDRDGVIVADVHFLRRPSQIQLLPGVASSLRRLKERFHLVVVSNQSGIARGLFTERDLLAIHGCLLERLSDHAAVIDALYYCPHLPDAVVPAYRGHCECRKPKPGMLLQAKADFGVDLAASFIVGDHMRDIEAGSAVGVKGILLGAGNGADRAVFRAAPDLCQAAQLILEHVGLRERSPLGSQRRNPKEGLPGV